MNNSGKLSIIIPCYNDHLYIEEAVNSALNQTYENKEIIVVDDGSDKQTKIVLKELEAKIDLLIIQENRGVSVARNIGIESAKGEYILVLDSDDYFEPGFCKEAIEVIKKDHNVNLVTCHARIFSKGAVKRIYRPSGGNVSKFILFNAALGSALFRKNDWLACGKYDESLIMGWEDWEFYIRLHESGGYTYVIPEALFNYRKKEESKTTVANLHKHELMKYIYIKHSELYIAHYESFVNYLINSLKKEEKEKNKNKERVEFRLGKAILSPLRWIKALFS